MTMPGESLRAIAALLCEPETMNRLIDPLIADMQFESLEAQERGHVWRNRWIRLSGCVTCCRLISLHVSYRRGLVWIPATTLFLVAAIWVFASSRQGELPPLPPSLRVEKGPRGYPPPPPPPPPPCQPPAFMGGCEKQSLSATAREAR